MQATAVAILCSQGQDALIADRIGVELASRSVPWRRINPGDAPAIGDWTVDSAGALQNAIEATSLVVAVISEALFASSWLTQALNSLISLEMSADLRRVVPLYVGDDAAVADLRGRTPLLHSRSYRVWNSDPGEIASALSTRLQLLSDSGRAVELAAGQLTINTAFWQGRYSESAADSRTILELALTRGEDDLAALSLANLLLIARSRGRLLEFPGLINRYARDIRWYDLSPPYRLRVLKELFVYHFERDEWVRSARYLSRMRCIDPNLEAYTPSDDWMPGTVRWRSALLHWLLRPSARSLRSAIIEAQEGVDYLRGRLLVNPNTAGLASAQLNVGWLYFLADDAAAVDYFESAAIHSVAYSPRTGSEARFALHAAALKFGASVSGEAVPSQAAAQMGTPRSYAFLRDDPVFARLIFEATEKSGG